MHQYFFLKGERIMGRKMLCCFIFLIFACTGTHAGYFQPVTAIDFNTTQPLQNPTPNSYQPRYISGFGQDDNFTVFFEDRDAAQAISFVQTGSGANGFPSSVTTTNIADTHFCVKDWPITIGATSYAYRAWGSVGNNTSHNFYVSNNLTNWTLISTFTIPISTSFNGTAHGFVYYGFHDVIKINGKYYAFGESNESETQLCVSANGDDNWEAIAAIGGRDFMDGNLYLPSGVAIGWAPSGSFFDLGHDRGIGKIYVDPRDSNFYLAVNSDAKMSLSQSELEAAFIDPDNWTWHDGSTGYASAPILSDTAEHDLRECWLVPSSNIDNGWKVIYDSDFGISDGGKTLAYFTLEPPQLPVVTDQPDDITICEGDNASFHVESSGSGTLLSYQWKRNGVNLSDGLSSGTVISGATTHTLELTGVAVEMGGKYTCAATYSSGMILSDSAQLNINTAASASVDLRVEDDVNPGNVTERYPEFTWSPNEAEAGDTQTAYRFQMAYSEAYFDTQAFQDTGKVMSGAGTYTLTDPTPDSGVTIYWRVKIWDACDNEVPYSATGTFIYSSTVPVELSNFSVE
jgi:Ig-like domain-containing protein